MLHRYRTPPHLRPAPDPARETSRRLSWALAIFAAYLVAIALWAAGPENWRDVLALPVAALGVLIGLHLGRRRH